MRSREIFAGEECFNPLVFYSTWLGGVPAIRGGDTVDSFQPFLGDTTGGQIDMYSARMHLSHGLCETFREFTRRSRFVQLPRTSLSSDPAPVEGTVRKKGVRRSANLQKPHQPHWSQTEGTRDPCRPHSRLPDGRARVGLVHIINAGDTNASAIVCLDASVRAPSTITSSIIHRVTSGSIIVSTDRCLSAAEDGHASTDA